ncbi:hypothetical protein OG474_30665 [Kribbella sp. NBC_01505]|uniref:hypothetical protein n=1 Tax=Kribbella sp. NBC_01505 TaxID=2903580 RepID=UPI003865B719
MTRAQLPAPIPSTFSHPVGRIQPIEKLEDGTYTNSIEPRGTTELMFSDAEVVLSQITGTERHTLMLDLDVPATLVPSTTPGHSHLYIDIELPWDQVQNILAALTQAGIVEEGYLSASLDRGFTTLRLPWVTKPAPEVVAA